MATYRRVQVPGTTYFFTLATYRRQPLLSHPQSVAAMRDAIRTVRKKLPFEIVAFVILPDHLHAIWTLPPGDADYPRRWALIKREAGRAIREFVWIELPRSVIERHESGVWQRRYWEHLIRDDEDLKRHVDYVHFNPVQHGYARCVADWRHSTFHWYVRRGLLPADWAAGPMEGTYGEAE